MSTPSRAASIASLARRRAPDLCTVIPHEGGFVAEGPGFYVWDEDPGEVIRIAEALRSGSFDGSQTARFLVIGAEEPIWV